VNWRKPVPSTQGLSPKRTVPRLRDRPESVPQGRSFRVRSRTLAQAGRAPSVTVPRHAVTDGARPHYVLFFIEHASRRVWLAGCTTNPDGGWVTQQARNLSFTGLLERTRFLIRDRDSKYSGPFDRVFRSEQIRIVKTPVRSPKANAIAERFVRTIRAECFDWLLILNCRHLEHVLRVYVDHYNTRDPTARSAFSLPTQLNHHHGWLAAKINRRDRLRGLLHEYYRAAA
jgi:putative transposase